MDGIRDVEDNLYPTARAGSQIWMTENLTSTTCSDGTPLDASNYQLGEDGVMRYNHLALEQCDLCPSGWRVPTPEDLFELRNVKAEVNELKALLNISMKGFVGNYMLFQDGRRLWHGDFESFIERSGAITRKGDENDYHIVRCIKIF
ncbi:MAG: FISUMP domain-containing protein [Bacteroidota bacterium]